MKSSLFTSRLLLIVVAMTALCGAHVASAAKSTVTPVDNARANPGAISIIPTATTFNIGPCQMFDTDGGSNPVVGGYVGGMCDPTYIISYTVTDSSYNYTISSGGNFYFGRVKNVNGGAAQIGTAYPNAWSMLSGYMATGGVDNYALFGSTYTTTTTKQPLFARDTPAVLNYNNWAAGTGIVEYAVGQPAGYTPVVTVNTLGGGHYVVISAKIFACTSSSFPKMPVNVIGNTYGQNLVPKFAAGAAQVTAPVSNIANVVRDNGSAPLPWNNFPAVASVFACQI